MRIPPLFPLIKWIKLFANNVAPIVIISIIKYTFTYYAPKVFPPIKTTMHHIIYTRYRFGYCYYKKGIGKQTLSFKKLTIELHPNLQATKIINLSNHLQNLI